MSQPNVKQRYSVNNVSRKRIDFRVKQPSLWGKAEGRLDDVSGGELTKYLHLDHQLICMFGTLWAAIFAGKRGEQPDDVTSQADRGQKAGHLHALFLQTTPAPSFKAECSYSDSTLGSAFPTCTALLAATFIRVCDEGAI